MRAETVEIDVALIGTYDDWVLGAGTSKVDAVQSPDDGDTSYIENATGGTRQSYSLSSHNIPEGSVINSVTVRGWARKTVNPGVNIRFGLVLGANESGWTVDHGTLATSYGEFTAELSRPGGGSWSLADIDTLEIGVTISAARDTRVSTLTAIVDYTPPDPAFTQKQFRIFENVADVDPVTPWTNGENEVALHIPQDEPVRMRINIEVLDADLATSTQSFKLQFAEKTETSCLTVASGNFSDVGKIASSTIWRGYNNTGINDGDSIGTLLLSSSTVRQSYEEENPTEPNIRTISQGGLGEWDFVVQNNGAKSDAVYCFRIITEGGEEISYERMAELRVVRGFVQLKYRWRNDDGGE